MSEPETNPFFVSVCTRVHPNENYSLEDVFRNIAGVGKETLYENCRIDIQQDDIETSEIEFSSDDFTEPEGSGHSYVAANFYDDEEIDAIHVHCYFFFEELKIISEFYQKISDASTEITVNTIGADTHITASIAELGFQHGFEEDISLHGVRFSYDSRTFSAYSTDEEGSVIRGQPKEYQDAIDKANFDVFVRQNIQELESEIQVLIS